MCSRWTAVWTALAYLALAPPLAWATDHVQEQLSQMQDRLGQLEDRLQATTDQLDVANQRVEEQQVLIERAGLTASGGASSGLAAFLESLEIGGWVSSSYWYNFNDPDGEVLGGANTGSLTNPFNPDANSFSLDQLWFELERPIDESQRAGFRADLVFGKTADLLTDAAQDGLGGGDTDVEIYQGYVQYLAPIGNGVTFQAGKFGTLIGAEVVQAPYNFNISRGNVYNLLQPITHVGLLASTDLGEGFDLAVGVVNDFGTLDIDNNNGKTFLGHLGYGAEGWSAGVNALWGAWCCAATADEEGDLVLLDLVLTWDPNEELSTWLNFDYQTRDMSGASKGEAWGIALAGRYAINDRAGFSLRGEWVDTDGGFLSQSAGLAFGDDVAIYSLTGTLDYKLTDKLMVRAELRWDDADVDSSGMSPVVGAVGRNDIFVSDSGVSESNQLIAGAEVIYNF